MYLTHRWQDTKLCTKYTCTETELALTTLSLLQGDGGVGDVRLIIIIMVQLLLVRDMLDFISSVLVSSGGDG